VRPDLDQQKTLESCHVEFARRAWVQIVLSAIYAVSAFMEGVVVYLVNCRIWLVSDVRHVLLGSCFEKLWP